MDPLPTVTEAMIRQHASADSFQRGDVYQAQGAVVCLVRRGQQLQAEVEGSQVEPYTVQITWDGVGITQVVKDSPAEKAGLKDEDVIVGVDDQKELIQPKLLDYIRAQAGKPWRKRWNGGLDRLKTPTLFELTMSETARTVTARG